VTRWIAWIGPLLLIAAARAARAPAEPAPARPAWTRLEVLVEDDRITVSRIPTGEVDVLAGYDWRALANVLRRLRPDHEPPRIEIHFQADGMIYRDMVRGLAAATDAGYDVGLAPWSAR
jgi:hypothetical protein